MPQSRAGTALGRGEAHEFPQCGGPGWHVDVRSRVGRWAGQRSARGRDLDSPADASDWRQPRRTRGIWPILLALLRSVEEADARWRRWGLALLGCHDTRSASQGQTADSRERQGRKGRGADCSLSGFRRLKTGARRCAAICGAVARSLFRRARERGPVGTGLVFSRRA
jgi:hypothetical protein